jgi:hypothetical protein
MKKMPEDLIKEIKTIYPDETEIHDACDSNSDMIGRYLDEYAQYYISAGMIVALIDCGAIEELKKDAVKLLNKKMLYAKWIDWYRSNHELKNG